MDDDARQITGMVDAMLADMVDEDFERRCELLIVAIEGELAAGTFPSIEPADAFHRYALKAVQAALAKTEDEVDVGRVIRSSLIRFCFDALEAAGRIEKTGELRAGPKTGELRPVYVLSSKSRRA